jgi:hypothetical protein
MNDREFSDIESFEHSRKEYRCLCSYYVINTYASLMYELKKIGKIFTSKFVGPRALVLLKKKNYRAAVSQRLRNTVVDDNVIRRGSVVAVGRRRVN